MMINDNTLKSINETPDHIRSEYLRWIVKNCSSYVVSPNGNEHWLFGNTILTKWSHDTGYTRTNPCGLAYPDNFESWAFHNDILASEAFDEHHELENY